MRDFKREGGVKTFLTILKKNHHILKYGDKLIIDKTLNIFIVIVKRYLINRQCCKHFTEDELSSNSFLRLEPFFCDIACGSGILDRF